MPELTGTHKNIQWQLRDSSDGWIPEIWYQNQWRALVKNGIDDPVVARVYCIDSIDKMIILAHDAIMMEQYQAPKFKSIWETL